MSIARTDSTDFFDLIIELLLKIVGNNTSTFKHAYCVCKSWYEKLSPYLVLAKSYKKQKQLYIPWYNNLPYSVYKGITFIRGDLIISRVSVNDIPELTFEISRLKCEDYYLRTQIVKFGSTYALTIESGKYENFCQDGELFIQCINCITLATLMVVSDHYRNGKPICHNNPPIISIYCQKRQ